MASARLDIVSIDPKKLAFDEGKRILGQSAGGLITKLAQHHKVTQNPANWYLVLHSIACAEGAAEPRTYIGGILNGEKIPKEARIAERNMRPATEEECKAFMVKHPWYGYVSREIPRWADERE